MIPYLIVAVCREGEEWYTLLYDYSYKPIIAPDDWNETKSTALWSDGGCWWKLRSRLAILIQLLDERRKKSKGSMVGIDRFTEDGVSVGEVNLFSMLHQAITGSFPEAGDFEPLRIKVADGNKPTWLPPYCQHAQSDFNKDEASGSSPSLRRFYDRMLGLPAVERVLSGTSKAGVLQTFFGPDPLLT